ncbi:MFS transporter [Streptomyces sp. 549]|uniref:MFS transporter n=1 Tax=Streptomyces sp. 549 TaxID=3049076 RepID=UPI0024C29A17|nr:MFS transporter [Streptomyces sp. 549]MDK1473860.1 MFS transporter [Streptomyces sp. 549]
MPHSTSPTPLHLPPSSGSRTPSALLAVSGSTLVAVDLRHADQPDRPYRPDQHGYQGHRSPDRRAFAPRRKRRPRRPAWCAPYVTLFATPGTRAFSAGALLARLPMGMFGVSAVLMISQTRGSYALAGAVSASGLAATALLAPLTARLVDRHGQARVAVPAVLLAVLAQLLLVLCVSTGAPTWTLFACSAAAATAPNTGGMARARWAHLHRGGDPAAAAARHTANSFEQALDELCFMAGPVLAAFLCVGLFPTAGTLAASVLLLCGTLLFAAQRRTEPPVAPREASSGRSPARLPGMPILLLTFVCIGAVFGSMEVATIAFADGLGAKGAAGVLLALQAAGSCAAGLGFGLLRLSGPPQRRFVRCVAAMAALMLLPAWAAGGGSLLLLAPALLLAGMATAPTMVTGMTLIQRHTPPARLNEGMTLAVTALLAGISAGAAVGGWAAEKLPGAGGYAAPVAAALLGAALATAGFTRRNTRGGRGRSAAPSV